MQYKLLIGNNFEGIGKKFADSFSHFGFKTSCCANKHIEILKELAANDYDGLIFFSMIKSDKIIDFVQECHLKYPDLKIYPITFSCCDLTRLKLKEAGAAYCITTPYTEYSVCSVLINDFHSVDDISVLPEVAEFLFNRGFLNRFTGFYYLCCAIEKAVSYPGMLKREITKLYRMVAETMNTTECNVERLIRVASTAAFKKGVRINGELTYTRLKNGKLISALTKEYAIEFGFEEQ